MRVSMKVDGTAIDLNAFTQEIIGNTAAAMAESLRGVKPDWNGIEIKIEKQ
jgi:hypothetical protein